MFIGNKIKNLKKVVTGSIFGVTLGLYAAIAIPETVPNSNCKIDEYIKSIKDPNFTLSNNPDYTDLLEVFVDNQRTVVSSRVYDFVEGLNIDIDEQVAYFVALNDLVKELDVKTAVNYLEMANKSFIRDDLVGLLDEQKTAYENRILNEKCEIIGKYFSNNRNRRHDKLLEVEYLKLECENLYNN